MGAQGAAVLVGGALHSPVLVAHAQPRGDGSGFRITLLRAEFREVVFDVAVAGPGIGFTSAW